MPGAFEVRGLLPGCLVAIMDEALHGAATIAGTTEDIQEHAVRDLEAGNEAFRRGGDQAHVGVLIPVHEILFGRLALDGLFAIAGGFFREF